MCDKAKCSSGHIFNFLSCKLKVLNLILTENLWSDLTSGDSKNVQYFREKDKNWAAKCVIMMLPSTHLICVVLLLENSHYAGTCECRCVSGCENVDTFVSVSLWGSFLWHYRYCVLLNDHYLTNNTWKHQLVHGKDRETNSQINVQMIKNLTSQELQSQICRLVLIWLVQNILILI